MKKRNIIGIIIIIFIVIIIFLLKIKLNNINQTIIGQVNKAESEEILNDVILDIEIKSENDTERKCVLTFCANNSDNKIKSIEYPEKDIINVDSSEGKDKISIDYDIKKGEEDKVFKVTTVSGQVKNISTVYNIIYDANGGSYEPDKKTVLKGMNANLETSIRDNYNFLRMGIRKRCKRT